MSAPEDIKFYFFHHHHYSEIPPDEDKYESTMVDYPNALYDPVKGHELYKRHLRTVCLADDLGFDGIAINEHHNMVYSMTPTVSVMAGAIVNATKQARIQVAGVPINLEYPNRVAEEYAMLDVMSGGRMEYAFPLGTGMEYWANAGTINPTTARARFRESLEVIVKAWTEDGPNRHDGDFYTYRFLNPFLRPYQKPRPKCFIVGTGSKETVQLAVDYEMGYSIVFVPIANQLRAFNQMRELAAERGREVDPDDLSVVVMAYVADTDEEAVREARPHIEKFFSWFHRVPPQVPGAARLRHDGRVPAPRLGRGHGRGHEGDVGRHGRHRPHRLRLRRHRRRHDPSVVRRGRLLAASTSSASSATCPSGRR